MGSQEQMNVQWSLPLQWKGMHAQGQAQQQHVKAARYVVESSHSAFPMKNQLNENILCLLCHPP